jgi:hypothetical protein
MKRQMSRQHSRGIHTRQRTTLAWGSIVLVAMVIGSPLRAIAQSNEFEALLLSPELWRLTADDLETRTEGLQFSWVSAQHEAARNDCSNLVVLGETPVETIVRFRDGTVAEVALSLYNRGDRGEIKMAVFDAQVARLCQRLQRQTGSPGREVAPHEAVSRVRQVRTTIWKTDTHLYRLETAVSRVRQEGDQRFTTRPEFITLTVLPAGVRNSVATGTQKVAVGYYALRTKVRHDAQGNVYLEGVPMVDQGEKGYCAVATVERVMRYYGVAVDEHEMAQRAMTLTGGGTDPVMLIRALRMMANSLNVRISSLIETDVNSFIAMVREYNRTARGKTKQEIELPTSGYIDFDDVFDEMDPAIFIASRTKNSAATARFAGIIREKIGNGYPLIWSVELGIVEETPPLRPNSKGGHVRLIIGYNAKTGDVIYTDSWGAGHERKTMKLHYAWVITTGLFTIEPK